MRISDHREALYRETPISDAIEDAYEALPGIPSRREVAAAVMDALRPTIQWAYDRIEGLESGRIRS